MELKRNLSNCTKCVNKLTRALKALGHLGPRALKALENSKGTRVLEGHSRYSGTWALRDKLT